MVRRASLLVATFFSLSTNLSAEPLPKRTIDYPYTLNGFEFPVGFASTAEGDTFTTYRTFDFTSPFGAGYIRRRNASGDSVWPSNFAGPPHAVAVSPDKTACVIFEKNSLFGLETQLVLKCIAPGGPTGSDPEVNLPGFSIFGLGSQIGAGVAIDQARDRIYAYFPSLSFQFGFEVLVVAYDRALNLIAQRKHTLSGEVQQLTSISVDANGAVWTSGVESFQFPDPRQVFVERYPPNLSTPPTILRRPLADFSIMLKAAGDPRGGVVIAGDRDSSGNSDTFRRILSDEVGGMVFGDLFRIQGYGFGPFTVDAAGAIYASAYAPGTGAPAITKRGPLNLASWSPEFLPLPDGRQATFLHSPTIDTFDVSGTIDFQNAFVLRYVPGLAASLEMLPVTPLDSLGKPGAIGFVSTEIFPRVEVKVRDTSLSPQENVPVTFTNPEAPEHSIGHGLVDPQSQSDINGRAKTGFRIGNLPLEYLVKAECPSCVTTANSISFPICGTMPARFGTKMERLFLQNVDDHAGFAGEHNWTDEFLDSSIDPQDKIVERGCALTAYVMMLNLMKARHSFSYAESTPYTLNEALKVSRPRAFDASAKLDMAKAALAFTGGQVEMLDPIWTFDVGRTALFNKVEENLALGNPALLHLQSQGVYGHFITVIGRCGTNYRVLDPHTGTGYKELNRNDLSKVVMGARIFKKRGT